MEHAARGPARVARVRCTPGDVPLEPWMRIVSSLTEASPPEPSPERSRFARFAEILDVIGAAGIAAVQMHIGVVQRATIARVLIIIEQKFNGFLPAHGHSPSLASHRKSRSCDG
jgi:hypothetical protein